MPFRGADALFRLNLPEIARRIDRLAERVDRLRPLNHDPERYFVDRGEVVADMRRLAQELGGPRESRRPKTTGPFRAGNVAAGTRSVAAEIRRARRPLKTGEPGTGDLKTGDLKTGDLKTGDLKTCDLKTCDLKTRTFG